MRASWNLVKFEELYLISSRNGLNRPSAVRGKGFKMINMGEIFAHNRLYDIDMELVLLNDREKSTHQILKGDLIFARQSIVAEGAGKCSIIMATSSMTCFESHIIRVRLDQEITHSLFYYYFFQSELGKAFLFSIRQQGVQAGIRGSDLAKTKIPLPPPPTQQKIAQILSAYDDLIENNLKRIKLLEEMAQITYEQWFVRMKFPNHETTPIDAETSLPEGWEYSKLSDEVELVRDSILPSTLEESVPYIGLEHMPRKSITLSKYGSSNDISSLKTNVKKGDILFGKIRPYFHKVGIALKDCITSTDNIVVRPKAKNNINGIILQTMFSEAFVSSAVQSSNGTKMPRANWKVLAKHKVIIPDIVISNKFSDISTNIISSVSNLSEQNQRLKEARDILLPRLMTGMIDVDKIKLPKPFDKNTHTAPAHIKEAIPSE